MAKVTGPFMSIDASGTIYKTLTASIWKGRNYIRGYAIPSNPQTTAQVAQREKFAVAVAAWQALPAEAVDGETAPELGKDYWNLFSATCVPAMSGFNAYVKAYLAAGVPPDIPATPYIGKKGIR